MPETTAQSSFLGSLLRSLLSAAGDHALGELFVEKCKEFLADHGSGTAKAVGGATVVTAGVLGGSALIPLAVYLTIFGVAEALKHRAEKRSVQAEKSARTEILNVIRRVEDFMKGKEGALERLLQIAERNQHFWAQVSSRDPHKFARDLARATEPAMKLLGANFDETLHEHWILNSDTNERVRAIEKQVQLLTRSKAVQAETPPLLDFSMVDPRIARLGLKVGIFERQPSGIVASKSLGRALGDDMQWILRDHLDETPGEWVAHAVMRALAFGQVGPLEIPLTEIEIGDLMNAISGRLLLFLNELGREAGALHNGDQNRIGLDQGLVDELIELIAASGEKDMSETAMPAFVVALFVELVRARLAIKGETGSDFSYLLGGHLFSIYRGTSAYEELMDMVREVQND